MTDAKTSERVERDEGTSGSTGGRAGAFRRRKTCRFCTEKDVAIDYRDPNVLKFYLSERGKIVPRRISGNCAKHQRAVARALKRARILAIMPFTVTG